MTPDLWLALGTVVFSAGGSFYLSKWRQDRADTDRAGDGEKHERDHGEQWSAINSLRNKLEEMKETFHAHEKASYEERLRIADKFSTVALAQSNLAGDLKASVATMARVEKKVDEIAEEVKKQ